MIHVANLQKYVQINDYFENINVPACCHSNDYSYFCRVKLLISHEETLFAFDAHVFHGIVGAK